MITSSSKRLTAEQVLEHPFMSKKGEKKSTHSLNIGELRNFMNHCKLKKAVLSFMASQLSEVEINELSKIFINLDKNGDGTLTIEELSEGKHLLKNLN